MGDLLSPRRRDVFDRLRRRIEHYRQQHSHRAGEFQPLANGLYKRYQSDTSLLQQRWQESRVKRASKTGKSSSVDQVTGDQPYMQSKLKRKLSGSHRPLRPATSTTTTTVNSTGGETDEIDHAASNIGHGSLNSSVSQSNKSHCSADTGQTSSVHTSATTSHTSVSSGHSPATSAPIEHSVSVNIVQQIGTAPSTVTADAETSSHIKLTVSSTVRTGLECKREPQEQPCSADSSNSSHASLPDSIGIEDVDELQAILDTLEKEADLAPDLSGDLADSSLVKDEGERRMFAREADAMYNEGYPAMMGGYGGLEAYTPRPTPAPPPPLLGGDTGPAAETLKQMAAQHQNHNPRYTTAAPVQEFGDVFSPGYRPTPVSYTGSYPQMSGFTSASGSQYPFGVERKAGMSYGGTRPLCHYSDSGVQSSLQQLQDQVQSHFSGAPPSHQGVLEMSQSQHMQLSHAGRAMHMSQTQQMRFAVPEPAGGGFPAMYTGDQMYEQQQAYMSRAPPSYKPPRPAYDNPLQTMQSMVNGTQLPPAHGVKLEGRAHQNPGYKVPRTKNTASAYTSTLMRGQRPPNVNVGPDGLNISQQRSGAWIRPCTRPVKPPMYNAEGYSLVPPPHMAQHPVPPHGGLPHAMSHTMPHAMSHTTPQYPCADSERVPPMHPSMQQQQTMVTMQNKNQQMALPVSYPTNAAAGGEFGMDFIDGNGSQTNYFPPVTPGSQTTAQPDFNFIDDFFAAK